MSKIKNGGLDQYGAGPSEQQQFGKAGVEGVKFTRFNIAKQSILTCNHNTTPLKDRGSTQTASQTS